MDIYNELVIDDEKGKRDAIEIHLRQAAFSFISGDKINAQ